ncbi:MAG: hypothetical protein HFJ34_04750 [Clostridia bacterium]|nr:hypothetical protein [Clostridia bacterium]
MEKNYISEYAETYFYIDLEDRIYGVCINIKDIDRKDEIMNYFYNNEKTKRQIGVWKREWQQKEGVA